MNRWPPERSMAMMEKVVPMPVIRTTPTIIPAHSSTTAVDTMFLAPRNRASATSVTPMRVSLRSQLAATTLKVAMEAE